MQELLSRLAATDALFAEPIPTIRDVAEATDASPLLIGRILSQMRSPDEVAALKGRMDGFEARLRALENSKSSLPPIEQALCSSGTGAFKPLAKQPSRSVVPEDLDHQKWSAVKERLFDDGKRMEPVSDEWLNRNSTYWVVVAIAVIYFMFVVGGQCNLSPTNQYERPVPFPFERSIR